MLVLYNKYNKMSVKKLSLMDSIKVSLLKFILKRFHVYENEQNMNELLQFCHECVIRSTNIFNTTTKDLAWYNDTMMSMLVLKKLIKDIEDSDTINNEIDVLINLCQQKIH